MTKGGTRALFNRILFYVALAALTVQAVGPVIWMLNGSVKDSNEFYTAPWSLTTSWQFANYPDAWDTINLGKYATNSVVVVVMALVILLISATLTAYALARLAFPGRSVIFGLVLACVMIPPDILIVPLFILLRDLNLLGTHVGLALIYASGGFTFAVILMRGYFMTVPVGLEEAAQLDGAGRIRRLTAVIIPLCLPGVLIVTVLQSLTYFNDLYLAMTFMRSESMYTIPVGLLGFFEQYSVNWPHLFAALAIVTIPVIIVFTLSQKWFVQGVRSGGVK